MHTPSTATILLHWETEPSIIIGILVLSALYFYGIGPHRARHVLGPPVGRGRIALFLLSDLVLIVGLLSPIDYLGDEFLFSAHMVQHLMLATVWPPIFLLAIPPWMVAPIFRRPAIGPIAALLTVPVVAFIVFFADLYLWHVPLLYDLTLEYEQVHILEHLTFLFFGLINWWPIISPIPEQRLSYGMQALYLFADMMLMMPLGLLFTFSPIIFYTPYLSAPEIWGISHHTDQELGGLIMMYVGNSPYAAWMVAVFIQWMGFE